MQEKLEQVQGHTLALSARLQQAEVERAQLMQQLREMHSIAGEAGEAAAEAAAAAAAQQVAGPPSPLAAPAAVGAYLAPKLDPGLSPVDPGSPSRSNVSNNTLNGGGDAVTTGGHAPIVPQGGAVPWRSSTVAAEPPKPRQPMFVAVTPAASHTRVQCIGMPAATLVSPRAPPLPPPPPPPLSGIPLLDLQSMSSAEDPLDCVFGR